MKISKSIKFQMQGTTLIEALVYLALFSILMGGSVAAAYGMFESSDRNQTKILLQQEGDFLIAKINWVLSGVQAINLPPVGSAGSILSVNKAIGVDLATGQPIIISVGVSLSGTDINLSRAGNPGQPLNNSLVRVSNLIFIHNFGGGADPESLQASFTLSAKAPNGMDVKQDFATTKYLRK